MKKVKVLLLSMACAFAVALATEEVDLGTCKIDLDITFNSTTTNASEFALGVYFDAAIDGVAKVDLDIT